MIRKYTIPNFVLAVVLIPILVFAVVQWAENRYQALPVLGPEGHTISNFQLKDQHGNAVTEAAWANKIVVAHYFFTHCPVICPKMLYQLKRVQSYASVTNLQLASFTVDPERDSSKQLQVFATRFRIEKNWQLLTGDKQQLYRLARKSFLITAT